MCKLMERAVALQLTNHIMINNLDEVFQSAYRHLHSTERAFLRVPNDILVALDNHWSFVLSLLDLSEAFTTVDHTVLLNGQATQFGITGSAFSCFTSYLSNRHQFISIRVERSSHHPLACGVPQRSVLGPYSTCSTLRQLGTL